MGEKVDVYLSLGSNLGNKRENIRLAIEKIGKLVGEVVRQSAFYETEPWGFQSENMFVNAAVKVKTTLFCCLTFHSWSTVRQPNSVF